MGRPVWDMGQTGTRPGWPAMPSSGPAARSQGFGCSVPGLAANWSRR